MSIDMPLASAACTQAPATHRPMLAVDVVGYGLRDGAGQSHAHSCMQQLTRQSAAAAGIDTASCRWEDRGDGLLLVAPCCTGAELLLGPLAAHLEAALRRHNAQARQPLHLRAAVHAGYVRLKDGGVVGPSAVTLFRMLEAPAFKAAMADRKAPFGVITSDYLHQEIVQEGPGLIDPAAWRPVPVQVKETRAQGWMLLPPARETS